MAKKVMSIRVEEIQHNRFKALSSVVQMDSEKLLSEMLSDYEGKLDEDQLEAFKSLLKCWNRL